MTKPVKTSTVLTRAAKWIQENGWTQHSYFKYGNGRTPKRQDGESWTAYTERLRERGCKACALGAIYMGITGAEDDHQLERRFSEAASYTERVAGIWPADWNDEVERTKEEVVAGLKEAAKAARKDGK